MRSSMEKQITISIEEYNKLIDMHTKKRGTSRKDRSKEVHLKVVEMVQKCFVFTLSLQQKCRATEAHQA